MTKIGICGLHYHPSDLVVCDIYLYHDNFDTALADFDICRKRNNYRNIEIDKYTEFSVWLHNRARNEGWFCTI